MVEEVKNLHFFSCATFSTRAVRACAGRATEQSIKPVRVDSLIAFKCTLSCGHTAIVYRDQPTVLEITAQTEAPRTIHCRGSRTAFAKAWQRVVGMVQEEVIDDGMKLRPLTLARRELRDQLRVSLMDIKLVVAQTFVQIMQSFHSLCSGQPQPGRGNGQASSAGVEIPTNYTLRYSLHNVVADGYLGCELDVAEGQDERFFIGNELARDGPTRQRTGFFNVYREFIE